MDIRRLVILNINDRPVDTFVTGKAAARHFDVYHVRTWLQVQALLSGQNTPPLPDLLLLDVSFDMDAGLRGAAMQGLDESLDLLVPMGPVLALPFLNSRPVMGFAPYSAHMENTHLKQHPPFLVAMGLIAAKMKGGSYTSRHLSLTGQDESLDNFVNTLEAAGNPVKGLEMALPMYRKNLRKAVKEHRVYILNSKELIETLDGLQVELEQRAGNASGREEDPYIDIPEGTHLETIDDLDNHDRISLLSLFADTLRWTDDFVDAVGINEALDWLDKLTGLEPSFPKAVAAIRAQDKAQDNDPHERRPRVDCVIQKLYGTLGTEERREIFRLCVLFANVHAWSVKKGISLEKKLVYQRLGFDDTADAERQKGENKPQGATQLLYKVDQPVYLSWFGARSRNTGGLPPIVAKNTIHINALSPFDPSREESDINRYFLNERTIIKYEDHKLIRKYRELFDEEEGYGPWAEPYLIDKS